MPRVLVQNVMFFVVRKTKSWEEVRIIEKPQCNPEQLLNVISPSFTKKCSLYSCNDFKSLHFVFRSVCGWFPSHSDLFWSTYYVAHYCLVLINVRKCFLVFYPEILKLLCRGPTRKLTMTLHYVFRTFLFSSSRLKPTIR